MTMKYTAKSLEEVAQLFERRAHNCERSKRVGIPDSCIEGEAATWLLAADILRCTTITEPDADDTARALVTKAEAA